MTNIVTQRFLKCMNLVLDAGRVKSARQFALSLDYLPQSLSEINRNRRDVTIDLVRRAVEVYGFNPVYLFTGEGAPLATEQEQEDHRRIVVTAAFAERPAIVHVPATALESYAAEQGNTAFVGSLPRFSLPDEKYLLESMRSFEVTGDSMEPTLFEGDKVVGHYVAPTLWPEALKDSFVYVVVTRSNVYIGRVYRSHSAPDRLQLVLDNTFYESQELAFKDIMEIWYVRVRLSPFLPAPSNLENRMLEQLQDLKEQTRLQSKLIQSLTTTIEKLAGSPNS